MDKIRLFSPVASSAWLTACALLTGCPLSDAYFLEPRSDASVGPAEAGAPDAAMTTADAGAPDAKLIDAAAEVAEAAGPPLIELAHNKSATASSEQTSKGNLAPLGNDGDSSSRWSAADGGVPKWWRVDLGAPHHLSRVEIDWEFSRLYGYLIEVSSDDVNYATAVDRSTTVDMRQSQSADLDVTARYVRVTVTAVTTLPISWPSFYEMRVFGK